MPTTASPQPPLLPPQQRFMFFDRRATGPLNAEFVTAARWPADSGKTVDASINYTLTLDLGPLGRHQVMALDHATDQPRKDAVTALSHLRNVAASSRVELLMENKRTLDVEGMYTWRLSGDLKLHSGRRSQAPQPIRDTIDAAVRTRDAMIPMLYGRP